MGLSNRYWSMTLQSPKNVFQGFYNRNYIEVFVLGKYNCYLEVVLYSFTSLKNWLGGISGSAALHWLSSCRGNTRFSPGKLQIVVLPIIKPRETSKVLPNPIPRFKMYFCGLLKKQKQIHDLNAIVILSRNWFKITTCYNWS